MSFVNNKGVRIHYQVIGNGVPVVMQHGFFLSVEDWYEFEYVKNLSQDCKLILVDARGHGESDKPYHPESYQLSNFTSDIVAVLDDIGHENAHYFGYSMGGWIGYGMAKFAPTRLDRLIIGGAQPYGRKFSHARKILELGIDAWISEISGWGLFSTKELERYRKNDAKALIAALNDRTDLSDILPAMNMPCLFYAGESDNEYKIIKELVNHVPNGTFFSLPNLNHIESFLEGKLVSDSILKFLLS